MALLDVLQQIIGSATAPDPKQIDAVTQAIESTGALDYTARLAAGEAKAAIACLGLLPDSSAKESLISLARFAVDRHY